MNRNITMLDMRSFGYCRRGVKAFLESHGYDWQIFLKEGVPADFLIATNNAMVIKVVEYVRNEHGNG